MTFSSLKIHLALALLLAASQVGAAGPDPATEIAAAERAIAAAVREQPRGDAGLTLSRAQAQLDAARALLAKRKSRDAVPLAQSAAAGADLARSQARLDAARAEVESKAARNADLRRRLLVNGRAG